MSVVLTRLGQSLTMPPPAPPRLSLVTILETLYTIVSHLTDNDKLNSTSPFTSLQNRLVTLKFDKNN